MFFFWSAFSHIQAEYGDLLHKFSYPGQIGQFSRSSDKSSFLNFIPSDGNGTSNQHVIHLSKLLPVFTSFLQYFTFVRCHKFHSDEKTFIRDMMSKKNNPPPLENSHLENPHRSNSPW